MQTKDYLIIAGVGAAALYFSGKLKLPNGKSLATEAGAGAFGATADFGGGILGGAWGLGWGMGEGIKDYLGWNTPQQATNETLQQRAASMPWAYPQGGINFINDTSPYLQLSDYQRLQKNPNQYPSTLAQYKKEVHNAISLGTAGRAAYNAGSPNAETPQTSNPYVVGTANWYKVEAFGTQSNATTQAASTAVANIARSPAAAASASSGSVGSSSNVVKVINNVRTSQPAGTSRTLASGQVVRY